MDYIYGKLSGVPSINDLILRVDTVEQEVNDLNTEVGTYSERITILEGDYEALNNKLDGKQDKLTEENAGENIEITTDPETGKVIINATAKNYNIGDGLKLEDDTISVNEFTNEPEDNSQGDTKVVTNNTYIENCKYGVETITYYDPIETLEDNGNYIFKLNNNYTEDNFIERLFPIIECFDYSQNMPLYGPSQVISDGVLALNASNDDSNSSQIVNENNICYIDLCNSYSRYYSRIYFDIYFPALDKEYWYVISEAVDENTSFINKWYEINYNNGGEVINSKGFDILEPVYPTTPSTMIELTSQEDIPSFIYNSQYVNPTSLSGATELINNLFKDICLINEPKTREEEITVKQKNSNIKDWTYEIKAEEIIPNETHLLTDINWNKLYQNAGYIDESIYIDSQHFVRIGITTSISDDDYVRYNIVTVNTGNVFPGVVYNIVSNDITLNGINILGNKWYIQNQETDEITYITDGEGNPSAPDITLYKEYILPDEEYDNYYDLEGIFKILVVTQTKTTPQKLSQFVDSLAYTTVLPTSSNDSGRLTIVLVDSETIEDIDKYDGYLYIGVEGLALQQQNSTNPTSSIDDGQISYQP